MSGNPIGNLKGKTGFGQKGYKPGSMIAGMNKKKDMKKSSKKSIKTTGKFKGKSNKLGCVHGGNANPNTWAPMRCNQKLSQAPLKPV